ncbi:MAG: hypothetical protein J7M26_09165 [Armatimonadetes bacterium]|nr:hypothetical protein [Armatimonadota bacterium]
MRIGLVLTAPPEVLDQMALEALERAGVWAVFLRCFEDEVRWRAPGISNFAHRVRESHLRLFLIPSGYGLLAPELQPSSLFLQVHPGTRQVDNRGRRLPRACPNNPRFLEWFTTSLRTLAWMIEADGFVWDEPGFHYGRGSWACRCRYCADLYAGREAEPLPTELTPAVETMRQQSIATLVGAATAAIKSVDQDLASLVLPTPSPQTGAVPTGNENWAALAQVSGVDGLVLTWPPAAYGETGAGGAAGLYTSAKAWVPTKTPLLLRLICPPDLTETEIALQQLKQLGLQAVLLEDSSLSLQTGQFGRRGEGLLDVVRAVTRAAF